MTRYVKSDSARAKRGSAGLSAATVVVAIVGWAGGGGCAVGPDYHAPQANVPDRFDAGPALLPTTIVPHPVTADAATTQPTTPTTKPAEAATRAATRVTSKPVELAHWWTSLDDAQLDALAGEAIKANFDIGIAVARLQQARTILSSTPGDALPSLDFTAGYGRGTGSNNTKGRVGAPLNAGTDTGRVDDRITFVGGFDAAWELDLFGHTARAFEAAGADVQAADEARKQVLVSVLAETARSYVDVRSLQLRLKIAEANVAALRRTLDLVRVRLNRGLGNELDVVLAERQLSAALARVAPLQAGVRQAERRVAVLVGRDPASLYAELDKPAGVPALPTDLDVGVPLDVLRRRPDVNRVERQLAASTARIGVATSNLFPRVALTAGLGAQGQGLGVSPPMTDLLWSAGPALRWPLLDFGQVDALIQYQEFRTKELSLAYRRTVLDAVREVEDAMGGYAAERNRLSQLGVAVASSERAVTLATNRYDLGVADFLNVLDAQRQLYELQDQLAVSQQTVTVQLVALYKSLGGGWESVGDVPRPAAPRPALVAAGAEVSRGVNGTTTP